MTQTPDVDQAHDHAHPLRRIVARLLDEVDAATPCPRVGLSTTDKEQVLLGLARVADQVAAVRLAVLAEADDVADRHATRTPGSWLARETRQDPATGRAESRLATALDQRWHRVAAAFADGRVNRAQVRVIVHALDDLPAGTDPAVLGHAEARLLELADELSPRELKRCGWRILELIAPDVVDDREREALERAEARARRQTRLVLRRTTAGMVRITADVPALHGELLKTQLHALLNPRRDHLEKEGASEGRAEATDLGAGDEGAGDGGAGGGGAGDGGAGSGGAGGGGAGHTTPGVPASGGSRYDAATGERIPYGHLLGHAFCSLLERVDLSRLPVHGASAATLLIHLDFDKLRADLGTATLGTGECSITPGEARRLACSARLLPAVLGGASEPMDLGRAQRLFSSAQRTALEVRHPHCQAHGCDIPAPWTEAHHLDHWERDQGPTDLDNGALLCSYHHHRIHDPAYHHHWRPDRRVVFRRRT